MTNYLELIGATPLFAGVERSQLDALLGCLNAQQRTAQKHDILLLAGDRPTQVGIVLSGILHITKEDSDGVRTIVASLAPGDLFAEALCCAGVAESPVTVTAETDAEVLLLPFERLLTMCPNSCPHHTRLIQNMLALMASKNLLLQSRLEVLRLKTIRAKVLHWLTSLNAQPGRPVTVPFNREQMADFLCVDRSALSHELIKMKRDGLIDYHLNTFRLK